MEAQHNCRMGARHLSQIKEESDSREQSSCFLPPIVQRQSGGGGACEPGVDAVRKQEVMRPSDPVSLSLYEQQEEVQENKSLLEEVNNEIKPLVSTDPLRWGEKLRPLELGCIEAELRETLRLDVERQREAEFLRQQENNQLLQNLCYLSLSQRVAKPWVSSYFRKFPMHMYCLPVQTARHRGKRRGLNKSK